MSFSVFELFAHEKAELMLLNSPCSPDVSQFAPTGETLRCNLDLNTFLHKLPFASRYSRKSHELVCVRGAHGLVFGTELQVAQLFGLSVVQRDCVLPVPSRRRPSPDKAPKIPKT